MNESIDMNNAAHIFSSFRPLPVPSNNPWKTGDFDPDFDAKITFSEKDNA